MNVRTITIGLPAAHALALDDTAPRIQALADRLRGALAEHEVAVRTVRVALEPFAERAGQRIDAARAMGLVGSVARACDELGIRWFCAPFDLTRAEHATTLDLLSEVALEVIRRHPRSFVHLMCAAGGAISYDAIARASRLIKASAELDASGYHNFRVGVGCNIRPATPFFPFAFATPELGFSLGLEMPPALLRIAGAHAGRPLSEIREALLEELVPEVARIDRTAARIAGELGLAFHGIDVSIAPFPEPGGSVAQLMEVLGVDHYGGQGTLFATAFLTDLLRELVRRAELRAVGFGGVMFSLLEDEYMGRRNNHALYGLDSLLLYSTVCGCGIDMVPVPGDTFEDELAALILDVATASTVLAKPLGVRVLPIPNRLEHEVTGFHMEFLFNTRIKKVRNLGFGDGGRALRGAPFRFLTR